MTAEQLKASILQMAIEGKLVPQLEEEPAVDIEAVEPEEVPFAIPEKWKWVSLADIVKVIPSKNYQIQAKEILSEGELPVVSQSKNYIDGYSNDRDKLLPQEDLPIILFGDHTRVVKFIDFQFVVGADGTKLLHPKDNVEGKFLYYLLQYNVLGMRNRGYSRHFQFLKTIPIPLPPLAEQRRIVVRLEELLPHIEEYGKANSALKNAGEALPDLLRASLLQEAIQGKLVPQIEEEPAVDMDAAEVEDAPFAISEKWKWVTLTDIVKVISSKNYQIQAKEILSEGELPVVSQSKNYIDGYSNDRDKLLPQEDLPIILFGDHTRVVKFIDFQFVVGADGTKLLHPKDNVEGKFLYYLLQYNVLGMRNRGYSRHFQFLKTIPIPLPPLDEQRRIVARLEELLPHVDAIANNGINL